MDILETAGFYTRPLGRAMQDALAERLRPALTVAPDQLVMGLGFAVPYLPAGGRSLALMMARSGVIHWPHDGPSRSALVDELALPLPDNNVDVALLVHALEYSESAEDMLAEVWRVLSPQGRLVMLVPNRRGFWSSSDRTPFGHGRPFSKGQINALLHGAQFSASRISACLAAPPWAGVGMLRGLEPLSQSGFGGVLLVEAVKQVHAYIRGTRVRSALPRLRPVLLPGAQPAHKG